MMSLLDDAINRATIPSGTRKLIEKTIPGGSGRISRGSRNRSVVKKTSSQSEDDTVVVGGAYEFRKPWELPEYKSASQFIETGLAAPMPGGVGGVVSGIKNIPRVALIGGGALVGAIAGFFFGGGQDQEQTITQTPEVTPTQDTSVSPAMSNLLETINRILTTNRGQAEDIDIVSGGGGWQFQSPTTTTTTSTTTENNPIQNTITYNIQKTISSVGATQTAEQSQGNQWLLIALAAAGGFLLGGGIDI